MTDDGFDGVDLDRLADYVGGALAGTADESAVARLVATDPCWAAACTALQEADLAVRADLDTLPPVGPVPDDVVAMLDRALATADLPTADLPTADLVTADLFTATVAPPPELAARPEPAGRYAEPTPPTRPRRPERRDRAEQSGPPARSVVVPLRRRLRTTALVGAAAAAVGAVAVLGLDHLPFSATGSGDRATVGQSAPRAASMAPPQILASGLDYTAGTVTGLLRPRSSGLAPTGSADPRKPPGPGVSSSAGDPEVRTGEGGPGIVATGVPAALAALYGQAGRDACVQVVTRLYGGAVTMLDYARFNGEPSLVLALSGSGPADSARIVVVGPRCGEAGTVSDERYSTLVR